MRLVFIDDSQQQNPPRAGLGHLLAIGAVIVEEHQVAGYSADLAAIRAEFGIPADEEIKWAPDKGSTLRQADWDIRKAIRRRMLEAAGQRRVKTIVVILDYSVRYSGLSQAEAGGVILKWLYERISMHLGDFEDIGIIIADKPGGGAADENKWLTSTLELTNYGTEYVRPDRVVLPIVTTHSHHLPHLQLADLVVASTTAAYAGRKSALELVPLLRPLIHRHKLGLINGAGIVQFPEHANLYYWVFGETGMARPSLLSGWALPKAGLTYYDTDGLPPEEHVPPPVGELSGS